jgi:hypothetical protein
MQIANFCIWKSTNNKFKSLTFNKNYNTQNNLGISIMMTQDQFVFMEVCYYGDST